MATGSIVIRAAFVAFFAWTCWGQSFGTLGGIPQPYASATGIGQLNSTMFLVGFKDEKMGDSYVYTFNSETNHSSIHTPFRAANSTNATVIEVCCLDPFHAFVAYW